MCLPSQNLFVIWLKTVPKMKKAVLSITNFSTKGLAWYSPLPLILRSTRTY